MNGDTLWIDQLTIDSQYFIEDFSNDDRIYVGTVVEHRFPEHKNALQIKAEGLEHIYFGKKARLEPTCRVHKGDLVYRLVFEEGIFSEINPA